MTTALELFLAGAQKKMDTAYANSVHHPKLSIKKGKKYTKIIKKDYEGDQYGSVYAFINEATGEIFKPASYAAPAKHARGNINNPDNGVGCAGPYGIAYLR